MKKTIAMFLTLLLIFSVIPVPALADTVQTHNCHIHTTECYETQLTCGVAQHDHSAACCSIPEHTHSDSCSSFAPTSHVCSESTGCVTGGCDGKHHNDNCYVVIEPGGSGKCPASHFNADGTHRDISCSNLPTTVLACLDPNHHEPSASCNGVTNCVHTNCDNSCPVCFTAVNCTISEHTHGVACDTSACSDAHHTDACYEDVLICGKEEVACTPEHCPTVHTHDWTDWSVTKEPSCGEAGEETRSCGSCDSVETRPVAALEHDWSDWSVTKAPSCGVAGEETRTCGNCSETETRTVTALEHSWSEWTESKTATCTEKGEESRACGNCGESETKEIDALGHVEAPAVQENIVGATCTIPGSYDEVVYCSVCGEELSRKSVTGETLAHDWSDWTQTKAPSCGIAGEETRTCGNCSETETRTVTALEHNWSDWTEDKAATCTEQGAKSRTCGNCGETEHEATDVLGHVEAPAVQENIVGATCTVPGSYEIVVYCSVCGEELSRKAVTNETLAHNWTDWTQTKTPSCGIAGEETRACIECAETEVREVAALVHNWGAWNETKAPTLTEAGEKARTCSICFATETRRIAPVGAEIFDSFLMEEESLPFIDVDKHDAFYGAVKTLYNDHILFGAQDDAFAPDVAFTRAMFAAMLYRMEGCPEVAFQVIFSDVFDGNYFAPAAVWMYASNLVEPDQNNKFRPNDMISVQDFNDVANAYLASKGIEVNRTWLTDADGIVTRGEAVMALVKVWNVLR